MKYVEEYREQTLTSALIEQIRQTVTRPWKIMEICGGQTHSILRSGLDQLLPPQIEFIHGPGCPVCVTPLELIDRAIALASRPDVIFTSYGDMLRVPGSERDLLSVKAGGGDVRIVYSPLDALEIAGRNGDKTVVFFGIGFETTAPANAMAVVQAKEQDIGNFAMLVSHVTVPPAIVALLENVNVQVDALLAAGHVCAVMGTEEYATLVTRFHIPVVVTGFEPVDIARGVLMCVRQLEEGRAEVENAYDRVVSHNGNQIAQQVLQRVFEPCDRAWRGIGIIPGSGYRLSEAYSRFDAERRFPEIEYVTAQESKLCMSGLILQGIHKPIECPAFGKECTPQSPLGATMVSSEGACAAYYRYGRSPSLLMESFDGG